MVYQIDDFVLVTVQGPPGSPGMPGASGKPGKPGDTGVSVSIHLTKSHNTVLYVMQTTERQRFCVIQYIHLCAVRCNGLVFSFQGANGMKGDRGERVSNISSVRAPSFEPQSISVSHVYSSPSLALCLFPGRLCSSEHDAVHCQTNV